MNVDTSLKEIDEAVLKHIGDEDESFRESVREAMEVVESLVGGEGVDDLARSVSGHIREHERRPAPKQVKEDAAGVVPEHGGELPEDSFLLPPG